MEQWEKQGGGEELETDTAEMASLSKPCREVHPRAACRPDLDCRKLSALSLLWVLLARSRKIGNIPLATSHYLLKRTKTLVFTGLNEQGVFVFISMEIIW